MRRLALSLCLAAAAAGCVGARRWPVIRSFFLPDYYPYTDNPRFLCQYPRLWQAGVRKVPGGIEIRSPDGAAAFSVAYLEPGTEGYAPPERFKREMTAWGSVEDEHRLYEVAVSSRSAYRVRFTTYSYDPEYLLGEKVRVFLTEAVMAPDPPGLYVVRYRAARERFWSKLYRKHYEHFLRRLAFVRPGG